MLVAILAKLLLARQRWAAFLGTPSTVLLRWHWDWSPAMNVSLHSGRRAALGPAIVELVLRLAPARENPRWGYLRAGTLHVAVDGHRATDQR
jgi:hypothetical protein